MSELSRLMSEHETAGAAQAVPELSNSEPQSLRSDRSERSRYATARRVARGRASRSSEWSSTDLRLLRELAANGTPVEAIASALRRTASGIRNKAGMHGISLKARR